MKRSRSIRTVLFVLMISVLALIHILTGLGTTVVYAADIPFYNGLALQYGNADNKLYHTGPLTTQTDNITMEAWVNIDKDFVPSGQYIRIMYNGNSATSGYGIYFDYNSATGLIQPCILEGCIGFVYTSPQVNISKGKWHHLAAVRQGGFWKLYVDGILCGGGNPGEPNIPGTEFSIGNSSYSNENFIGCVDEVRFWNVARSADDIRNNMYIKLQGDEAGLLGYYDFEEAGVTAGGNNAGITSTVTNKALSGSSCDLTLADFGLIGPTSNFVQSVQLGQFQFENPSYSVVENEGNIGINITRTSGSEGVVTLNYSTSDSTALAGTNYSSTSGSVTFGDGETTKEIVIPISYCAIADTKDFDVTLSALSGVSILNSGIAAVNILPDTTAPSISNVSISPTGITNGDVTVTVTASDASGIAATGGYSFDGGTTWQDGNSKVYSANTTIAAGQIQVKDKSGNTGSYGTQIDIANIDTDVPALTAGAVSRTNITDGTVKFTSSEAGQYYYELAANDAPAPSINTTGTGIDCPAGETAIILTGLSDFTKDLYIEVKDAAGNVSSPLKIDLDGYSSTTANSLNNTVALNLSSVFTGGSVVIAASGDRQATVSGSVYGDERFIPSAWTSEEAGKSGTFSLQADNYTSVYTTSSAGNYTITAEFVKQQWNGTEWVDVGSDNKTAGLVVSEPGGFRLNAAPGNSMVSIEWESVTDAVYYDLYENNTLLCSVTADVYQYDAGNLINGSTYYFKVKALDSDNTVISISDEVGATPRTVPGAPTNAAATAGDGAATVTFTAPEDNGGSPITGYIVTSNPGGIMATGTGTTIAVTGLSNGTAYTFTVRAINAAGNSPGSAASGEVVPYRPSGGNSGGSASSASGVDIIVNGKPETAATAVTAKVEDQTVTTVTVDAAKVEARLKTEGSNAVITIPVNNAADVVVGQLNGQTVKNMEEKEAVLEVKTETATYTLPASQINIDDVSQQIGRAVQLKDISVNVTIGAPQRETAKVVEDTANKDNYLVVVKPVEFEITCTSGSKTVPVSKFNAYVERTVAIPDGVDPSKITTGVVLNADGTFSHVPTVITKVDGKYYAKINSLTNSTYSVIWSPRTFKDVEKHWAKDTINDMGSRLVFSGVGNDMFAPDRDITRGEFAAAIVKALGLMRPGTGKDAFGDVSKTDWYYDAVSIAYENGILSGYGNGKFGPMNKLTREQAMEIIAGAMKITGLKSEIKDSDVSIAACLKTGVITGRNGGTIAPGDYMTRSEAAVIIQRLLQKSNLI